MPALCLHSIRADTVAGFYVIRISPVHKDHDFVKSGSALEQLTLKPSVFKIVLPIDKHVCRKEEKQNAFRGL